MTLTSVKSIIIGLGLAGGLISPLPAQTGQADAVKVRLLAFSRVGEDTEVQVVDPAGTAMSKAPISLPTQQLSPAHSLAGRSLLFTSPADPKRALAKVVLPASGNEYLLVFFPAAKDSAEPYKVDAVPLPDKDYGSGDYAFLNYCGDDIGCEIAGQRLEVPQGKSAVFHSAKAGKRAGNHGMVCYRKKNGVWDGQPFFSGRIVIQDRVRNLQFFFRNPSGEVDSRGIVDFVD